MNILGIETSCDETAAAVVRDGRIVLRSAVASQMAVHAPFKGVVPELASRAHVERINDILNEALGPKPLPIDAVAVTAGPGLVGCLLVGAVTAQTWAWVKNVPVIGVNHLEGHLFAGLVEHKALKPPFLGLIVSGGHTELVIFKGYGRYEKLGATRDDAAGEAFDKVANLLGLPFPGGPAIDRLARKGNPKAIAFPRPFMSGTWDFSFSGLKTAVANHLRVVPSPGGRGTRTRSVHGERQNSPANIAASFQESVVDVLVKKTLDAAQAHRLRFVVVGGGVAANRRLREAFQAEAKKRRLRVFLPDLSFCTDNAAMIAAAGYYQLTRGGKPKQLAALRVDANLGIKNW